MVGGSSAVVGGVVTGTQQAKISHDIAEGYGGIRGSGNEKFGTKPTRARRKTSHAGSGGAGGAAGSTYVRRGTRGHFGDLADTADNSDAESSHSVDGYETGSETGSKVERSIRDVSSTSKFEYLEDDDYEELLFSQRCDVATQTVPSSPQRIVNESEAEDEGHGDGESSNGANYLATSDNDDLEVLLGSVSRVSLHVRGSNKDSFFSDFSEESSRPGTRGSLGSPQDSLGRCRSNSKEAGKGIVRARQGVVAQQTPFSAGIGFLRISMGEFELCPGVVLALDIDEEFENLPLNVILCRNEDDR